MKQLTESRVAGLTALVVLVTIGVFTRVAAASAGDTALVLLLTVAVLGVTTLSVRWSTRDQHRQAQGNANRSIRLVGGFRAVAARMGLQDPWPGRPAEDYPKGLGSELQLEMPALRGTYRQRRMTVTVSGFAVGGDGYDDSFFRITVRARRGERWPTIRLLGRGKPPVELPASASAALERLKTRQRDRELHSVSVDGEALTCVVRDRISNAVSLELAKVDTALVQPTELEATIDDLITLADGLPVVDANDAHQARRSPRS